MVCHAGSVHSVVGKNEMWKTQQVHEDARTMYRAEILGNMFGKMEKATLRETRNCKKNGQAGRSFDLVQKLFGLRTAEHGTLTDELLQAEQVGTKGHGKMLQRIQTREDGRILAKEARNWKTEGQNRRIIGKEHRRLRNGRIYGAERSMKRCQRKDVA